MDHSTREEHDDATDQTTPPEAERNDPEPKFDPIAPVEPTRPGLMGEEVGGTSTKGPQVLRAPELVDQAPPADSRPVPARGETRVEPKLSRTERPVEMRKNGTPSRTTGPPIRYGQAVCHRVDPESGNLDNPLPSEEAGGDIAARERYQILRTRVGEIERLLEGGSISLDKEGKTQYQTLKESMAELEKVLTAKDQPAKAVEEKREVLREGAKIEEAVEMSEVEKFSGQERSGPRNAGDRVDRGLGLDSTGNWPPLPPFQI